MRYPEFLQEGGTIGFIAPSFGCNIEPYASTFAAAKKKFAQMGFSLAEGPNCQEGCGIGISNTPQKCGEEINAYYTGDEADVLISCGGGELMCEDLPYVDFVRLKNAKPKWFMGYSDNTNLTFLLTTLCDTASVYGPCVSSFGMEEWHLCLHDAFALLCGKKLAFDSYGTWELESFKSEENPYVGYHLTETTKLVLFREKYLTTQLTMEGRLLGGCMDCLGNLVGTKFDKVQEFAERYKEDGIIWFLESCELNTVSIRRSLWQMEQAGWFANVKGFLIGRPMVYGEEMFGLDQYDAVTGILGKYGVPIVMDADLGHLPPMMPLICGSYAKISAGTSRYTVKMELK